MMNCESRRVPRIGLIGVAAVALGAVVFDGCGGGAHRASTDDARMTATADHELRSRLGLAEPTATPDTSSAVSPEEASTQLANVGWGFAAVLDAVAAGDVDAFLKLLEWQTGTCGMDRGYTYCPSVAAGEQRPLFHVGGDFVVTAEALRPSLDLLLRGTPLALTYVAQLKDTPSRYYAGFESPTPKGRGILPVTDSDLELTGMLITLDANAGQPIVAIDFSVSTSHSAIERAGDFGFETQRIIAAVWPSLGSTATAMP